MMPGHCFVWFMPKESLTFYSVVMQTEPDVLKIGYRLTRTFGGPFAGQEAFVLEKLATILLSQEQMDLAARLGWPQDEETLRKVFAVPPS